MTRATTTTTTGSCAGPGCGRPLPSRGTGRPGRYCGANCRQAARRARIRAEEAEQLRRTQLAEAKDTATQAGRLLAQEARAAGALAAAVAAAAAGDDWRALADARTAFRDMTRAVEALATRQFDAAARAARLRAGGPALS
jgi:hypothetical protein